MKIFKLSYPIFLAVGFLLASLYVLPVDFEGSYANAAPLWARATVTTTEILVDGTTHSLLSATADGEKFTNTRKELFFITNDYTATVTATFVTAGTFAGFAIADVAVPIAASTSELVGPFNIAAFNVKSGSDKNMVYVNWDAVGVTGIASITVRAYKLDDGN